MDAKHALEKWEVTNDTSEEGFADLIAPQAAHLPDMYIRITPGAMPRLSARRKEEIRAAVDATAGLVAAAPELLEALRGVLRVADRATVEFVAARAAIIKATGSDE